MLRHKGPTGYVKKVLIVCERSINHRTGEIYKGRERMYHSPEAAAEWYTRFAIYSWGMNFMDKHGRVATAVERKARTQKYKRRALPIFKAKFDQLV